jgi:virulence-associated protein VagC
MTVAKIFWSGNSQAIRLPRAMRFPQNIGELEMVKDGERLILSPCTHKEFGPDFLAVLGSMPDFRRPPQKRTRRKRIFS